MGCDGLRIAPPILRKPCKNEVLADELRQPMLGWRHAGFSAHNEVRVAPEDAEGHKKFDGYMPRTPMSLEKRATKHRVAARAKASQL